MYEDGLGIPQDYVLAHMWMNISAAAEKVDNNAGTAITAKVLRKDLAKLMNSAQLAKAQELARKCTANKFKGC